MLYKIWCAYAAAVALALAVVSYREKSLFAISLSVGMAVVFVRSLRPG